MLRATEEPSSTGEPMDEEAEDAMAVVSSSAVMELRARQQRA